MNVTIIVTVTAHFLTEDVKGAREPEEEHEQKIQLEADASSRSHKNSDKDIKNKHSKTTQCNFQQVCAIDLELMSRFRNLSMNLQDINSNFDIKNKTWYLSHFLKLFH